MNGSLYKERREDPNLLPSAPHNISTSNSNSNSDSNSDSNLLGDKGTGRREDGGMDLPFEIADMKVKLSERQNFWNFLSGGDTQADTQAGTASATPSATAELEIGLELELGSRPDAYKTLYTDEEEEERARDMIEEIDMETSEDGVEMVSSPAPVPTTSRI